MSAWTQFPRLSETVSASSGDGGKVSEDLEIHSTLSQFVTQENLSAISGPPLPLTFQK
jgi:hypothetical protein